MDDSYSGARTDDACFEEPGQAETHEDVEHVAADGVADGHVPVTLLHHGHSGETVRDADPGCDEGETHHGVGDAQGEPNHGDHPHHHVAETFIVDLYKTPLIMSKFGIITVCTTVIHCIKQIIDHVFIQYRK